MFPLLFPWIDMLMLPCQAGRPDQGATPAAATEERAGGSRRARGPRRRGRGDGGPNQEALDPEVNGEPYHSSAALLTHPQPQQQQQQQHADGPGASSQNSTYSNPVFADDSSGVAAAPSPDVDANATGLSSVALLRE